VRLLVLDCDGVLTDGHLIFNPAGEIMQRFSIYDGFGIECAKSAGIEVAVLTGRRSAALMHRAQGLGIRRVVQGATDKVTALRELSRSAGVALREIAFVGDELFDIPAMRAAGWTAAPSSARPEVKDEAAYLCECPGGGGAVREIVEVILRAKDAWPPPGTVEPVKPGD
jgi:3-deoxy-D-manno-octulosonate 8-phosphate phosphatase (KDO 8-P phosphatase)